MYYKKSVKYFYNWDLYFFYLIISKFNTSQISIKVNYYLYNCIFLIQFQKVQTSNKVKTYNLNVMVSEKIFKYSAIIHDIVQMCNNAQLVTVSFTSEGNIQFCSIYYKTMLMLITHINLF